MHYLLSIDAEEWAMLVGVERRDWTVRIVEVLEEWKGVKR